MSIAPGNLSRTIKYRPQTLDAKALTDFPFPSQLTSAKLFARNAQEYNPRPDPLWTSFKLILFKFRYPSSPVLFAYLLCFVWPYACLGQAILGFCQDSLILIEKKNQRILKRKCQANDFIFIFDEKDVHTHLFMAIRTINYFKALRKEFSAEKIKSHPDKGFQVHAFILKKRLEITQEKKRIDGHATVAQWVQNPPAVAQVAAGAWI